MQPPSLSSVRPPPPSLLQPPPLTQQHQSQSFNLHKRLFKYEASLLWTKPSQDDPRGQTADQKKLYDAINCNEGEGSGLNSGVSSPYFGLPVDNNNFSFQYSTAQQPSQEPQQGVVTVAENNDSLAAQQQQPYHCASGQSCGENNNFSSFSIGGYSPFALVPFVTTRWKIAVFDSGIGGLSGVREIMSQLPYEEIVFFGDSLNCPYGPRSAADIKQLAFQAVRFLMKRGDIKALLLVCGSTSCMALDYLQKKIDIPVIGVLGAASMAAAGICNSDQVIGVLASECVVTSHAYEFALRKLRRDLTMVAFTAPKLAPMIERCLGIGEEEMMIIREAVSPFQQQDYNVSCLILGATHYAFVMKEIQQVLGPKVRLIDPAVATVMHMKQMLGQIGVLNDAPPPTGLQHEWYVTKDQEHFDQFAKQWLEGYCDNLEGIKSQCPDMVLTGVSKSVTNRSVATEEAAAGFDPFAREVMLT